MVHFVIFKVILNVKMNFARNRENLLNFVKVMLKILAVPFFLDRVHGVVVQFSARSYLQSTPQPPRPHLITDDGLE